MVSELAADVALAQLTPEDRALVEEFRERVRELLGPRLRDLRLFGSKVRGDDHDESDVDFLVLVQDLDRETWQAVVDLAYSIRGPSALSPHIRDCDDYHAPKSRA